MTNATNNKSVINSFDVALLVHTKGNNLIGGAIRQGYAVDVSLTQFGGEPGAKFKAQMKNITDKLSALLTAKKVVAGNRVLIVGDDNLCAKIRTIGKYALAGETVDDIVERMTIGIINAGKEVDPDYEQACVDFTTLIHALVTQGNITFQAYNIYDYPVDRFNLEASGENRSMPVKSGTTVTVKNGELVGIDGWNIKNVTTLNGDFVLEGGNGRFHLKKSFLSVRAQQVSSCFNDMMEKMPKPEIKAVSFADI